ncbi:hypothetical protein Taro_037501 [Colocasia esculenta]|uniref:Uncharacterized protein n=1 Tax=Colocasia esculenta TaxID=4460 RepID=A0A843W5V4_COLES|nr:hypothetical protein [Colocasia esculenta]
MVKQHKILEFRERLDNALASPGLSNENSIKSLVKNQLLRSPFCGTEGDLMNVIDKRSREVSNFVEMMRSVSLNDKEASKVAHTEWKIKQDTEQFRVMYREGPQGSPFHTLLAEGYVDGPLDVCLCVSWETTLYKKWWPQFNIPTFKIIMSTCLQKVRVGEEISLVRVKVPWPMSEREALLHYFELEYFEEDLVLVLLSTIHEGEDIDLSTHGFTNDGILEAKDVVRIDVIGGFVIQKISPTRCYFRTIANMDIKLDFVPPSLINFISRQLIGNGYKLFQKAVGSVARTDEDYREALKGQMYVRVREGVDPFYKSKTILAATKGEEKSTAFLSEEQEGRKSLTNLSAADNPQVGEIVVEKEEVEEEERDLYLEANQIIANPQTRVIANHKHHSKISPEVEHALNMLNEAIAIFRDLGSPVHNQIETLPSHSELQIAEKAEESTSLNERELQNYAAVKPPRVEMGNLCIETFRDDEVGPKERQSSDSGQNMPVSSPNESIAPDGDTARSRPMTPTHEGPSDGRSQVLTLDHMSKVFDEVSAEVNGARGSGRHEAVHLKKTKRKHRFCCLSFA